MIIVITLLSLLAIASTIVGIWQFFIYIKLSWARRSNSKDFNGLETARAVLDKNGDEDIRVKKSFWSLTYVRYSSVSKTLKLGAIDSRRKSLWTVATVGRQAYSAHVIKAAKSGEKPPISLIWFKLQTFWFGFFISMIFNLGIFTSTVLWITNFDSNAVNVWFWVLLLILIFVPLIYATATLKTSKLMLKNIDQIFGGIFTEEEIGQIQQLWKLEYINAIIEMIQVVIVIVWSLLKVILLSKASNNN